MLPEGDDVAWGGAVDHQTVHMYQQTVHMYQQTVHMYQQLRKAVVD